MKYGPPTADEFSLVFDAWANSFRKSPWAGCVPNHLWDQVSRAAMAEIIDRGAKVVVAYVELEAGRRIVGYSVSEPGVLHWLYVKRDQRGLRNGRDLLAETTKDWTTKTYTHRTTASAKFLGPDWRWDPVPARKRKA